MLRLGLGGEGRLGWWFCGGGGVWKGDEGGQPGQASEGGVPSVGPGRGV